MAMPIGWALYAQSKWRQMVPRPVTLAALPDEAQRHVIGACHAQYCLKQTRRKGATNDPPASERDYWDRILNLAKDNGDSFTLDQIHEEFDLSSREIKKIIKLIEEDRSDDAADSYESAEGSVQAWEARTIAEQYDEERSSMPDKQRIEGLRDLRFFSHQEFKPIDIDDHDVVQAIDLKYVTLNQIFLYLRQKGVLHGWF